MGMFEIFIVIVVIAIAAIIYFSVVEYKKKKKHLADLEAEGFKISHHMKGSQANVAIDVENSMVAFVCSKRIKKVALDDFREWRQTFVEKNETVNGVHKHTIENNALEFTINDPVEPLIRVPVANYDYAREWVARFSAIING